MFVSLSLSRSLSLKINKYNKKIIPFYLGCERMEIKHLNLVILIQEFIPALQLIQSCRSSLCLSGFHVPVTISFQNGIGVYGMGDGLMVSRENGGGPRSHSWVLVLQFSSPVTKVSSDQVEVSLIWFSYVPEDFPRTQDLLAFDASMGLHEILQLI